MRRAAEEVVDDEDAEEFGEEDGDEDWDVQPAISASPIRTLKERRRAGERWDELAMRITFPKGRRTREGSQRNDWSEPCQVSGLVQTPKRVRRHATAPAS